MLESITVIAGFDDVAVVGQPWLAIDVQAMVVPQIVAQPPRTLERVPQMQLIEQSHQTKILLINRFWLVIGG